MKVLLQNIVFFICLFTSILSAQNLTKQEMLEFYPHYIGDSWFYLWLFYHYEYDFYEAGSDKLIIPQDTVVNDSIYWLIESYIYGYNSYDNYYLKRVDTLTGNVLRIDDSFSDQIECVDNLYAKVGDTVSIRNNRYLIYCDKLVVLSLRDTMMNNIPTTIRKVIGLPDQRLLYFARNIGMLGSGEKYWIDSAYVNGVGYGDITNIKDKNEPIIGTFVLYHNYPNPFNPVTTIDYSLPKSAFVAIKIYDFLGREIKTLVSEEKSRGNYSLRFNGSNFASGIYFYQIRIGNEFIDTKKMILLK